MAGAAAQAGPADAGLRSVNGLPGIALDDWRAQSQAFHFRGHTIRYWTAGDTQAQPLLLIHGFPSASWDWHRLWAPLAERYRLIACDMLGFGRIELVFSKTIG